MTERPLREPGAEPPRRSAPEPPVSLADHELFSRRREREAEALEIVWFNIDETARLCRRSPSTVRTLVSRYQLRRRIGWITHRRLRRRMMFLSPNTVRWIQNVTLFGRTDLLESPPR